MNKKNAVILLSGGLDSVVSLACAINEGFDVKLALTFDYGQKAFEKELNASSAIADYYNIEHKVIKLDWLKEITQTSLVSNNDVPNVSQSELNDMEVTLDTMMNVWVPNRNGVFVNIAAAFCDSFLYNYIIIGANKEEAATFPDNSRRFIESINKSLLNSTTFDIEVYAPLIRLDKTEIVKNALSLNVPLPLINSCYNAQDGHCGRCESCNRLRRALEAAGQLDIVKELFKK